MSPAIIALIGQGAASLIGELFAGGKEQEARRMLSEALRRVGAVDLPDLNSMEAQQLGSSEAGAVRSDPALRAAQMAALNRLNQVVDEGGMTLEDEAAMNKMMGGVARQESAGRNAIANEMRARGTANSGTELAMMLSNQQAGAERASQAGMDRAGMAQRRALEAMMGRGQMAGQIRGQDFGENMSTAAARDAISRYNTAARERALQYNNAMRQQQFGNKMAKATGQNTAGNNIANLNLQQAQGDRVGAAGLGVAGYEVARNYAKGLGGGSAAAAGASSGGAGAQAGGSPSDLRSWDGYSNDDDEWNWG